MGIQTVLTDGTHLLDTDESTLPLAENKVLQGRDGEKIVFRIHSALATPESRYLLVDYFYQR